MRSPLHDSAVIHDQDLISLHDRAQTVRNHKDRVIPFKAINGLLNKLLTLRVKGTGGFIKNEKLRVAQDGSS
jgi:hypothetical protein